MKLSEQLGSPKTRTKKRKRELIPDYETVKTEDYTLGKHPLKKNKSSTIDQDNLNIESGDKHSPNESDIRSLDSQQDDKTNRRRKSDEVLRNEKTEDGSSNENQTDKCSNLISIQNVIDDGKVSPKKIKKQKNRTNQNPEKVVTIPSNDATDLSTNLLVDDSRSELSQAELSSPKKNKKEKKVNRIDVNALESASLISSRTTNPAYFNSGLRPDDANVTEEPRETNKTIERTSPRKRKKKNDLDTDSMKSESISANDAVNATDSDPSSHFITDVSESIESNETELPRKLRKKKKKLDKNFNVAESLILADASENVSTASDLQSAAAENISTILDSSTKPLKSCLKKKKRKNKKKKNHQSLDNSLESEKKLSNRSVSFDNNVKIELIENCLSKSILAQEAKNTAVNARKKIKALAYLRRWKEDRQNWKFEKLTQSWLLKNMFNQDLVPNDEFDLLLEYIVDLKGAARNLVNNLCGKVITKMEQKAPEEEDKELEAAYPRARSVQQYLQ